VQTQTNTQVNTRRIFLTWWPLAISWLFMALELPTLNAALGRLPDATIQLAAFGGIAFPFAMLIESPILMLLSASTALSRDLQSYRVIYRYMMWAGAILTTIHCLLAATPLFDLVLGTLVRMPKELIEPTRTTLMVMTPWTWAIAFRRFHQGVLIRFGFSKIVGIGTAIRLGSTVLALLVGLHFQLVPGAAMAAGAIICGVLSESLFIGIRTRAVVRDVLAPIQSSEPPLTMRYFLTFYLPLATTSIVSFIAHPLGSIAISRMPQAVDSLAVWPVVAGLTFVFRSFGYALNEVVISYAERLGARIALKRFCSSVAVITTALAVILAFTPFGNFVFSKLFGLPEVLVSFALSAFVFALPMPAISAFQSWYQGLILNARQTREITKAVLLYLTTISVILFAGIWLSKYPGVRIAAAAFTTATFVQLMYLRKAVLRGGYDRDLR